MSFEECHKHLQDVLQPLCAYFPSISTYDRALLIVEETGFHFYDALIVAAAVESGCGVLLTEDLQHGRKIGCDPLSEVGCTYSPIYPVCSASQSSIT